MLESVIQQDGKELMNDARCDCVAPNAEIMQHIFNECVLTRYVNGLEDLQQVVLAARGWINDIKN